LAFRPCLDTVAAAIIAVASLLAADSVACHTAIVHGLLDTCSPGSLCFGWFHPATIFMALYSVVTFRLFVCPSVRVYRLYTCRSRRIITDHGPDTGSES